jgi:RNA polymerase sigma-70 factor (ECF subfamily)
MCMNARSESVDQAGVLHQQPDFAEVFHTHYPRIARVIARMVQDPGRAEELAAEVFWKYWRNSKISSPAVGSWLYRSAVRTGLDELRRQHRRSRYEKLFGFLRLAPSPEQLLAVEQDQQRVRSVLSAMRVRDAEMLILRSDGLSYQEVAEVLQLNETSIGTLFRRAQQAFRKEYVKRYGQPNS